MWCYGSFISQSPSGAPSCQSAPSKSEPKWYVLVTNCITRCLFSLFSHIGGGIHHFHYAATEDMIKFLYYYTCGAMVPL